MSKIGYIRVSTEHQETARQEELMKGLALKRFLWKNNRARTQHDPNLQKC